MGMAVPLPTGIPGSGMHGTGREGVRGREGTSACGGWRQSWSSFGGLQAAASEIGIGRDGACGGEGKQRAEEADAGRRRKVRQPTKTAVKLHMTDLCN